jgi:hypothetical protein
LAPAAQEVGDRRDQNDAAPQKKLINPSIHSHAQTLTAATATITFTTTRLPEDRPVDIVWLPGPSGRAGAARRVAAVAARLAPVKKAVGEEDRARVRARVEEVERGRKARTAQILDRLPSRPGRVMVRGGGSPSTSSRLGGGGGGGGGAGAARPASAGAAAPAAGGARRVALTPAELRVRVAEASHAATVAAAAKPGGAAKRGAKGLLGRGRGRRAAAAARPARPGPPATIHAAAALPPAAIHAAASGSLRSALIGLLAAPGRAWTSVASVEKALTALAGGGQGTAGGRSAFCAPTRETLTLALKDVGEYVPPGRWALFDDLEREAAALAAAAAAAGLGGGEEEMETEEGGESPPSPAAKRARSTAGPPSLPPPLESLPSGGGGLRRTRSHHRAPATPHVGGGCGELGPPPLLHGPSFAALCDSYAARHATYVRLHASLRARRVEHSDLTSAAGAARAGAREGEAARLERAARALGTADGPAAAQAAFDVLHADLARDRALILDFQARAEEV